jgi:hypothetical protein
MPVEIIDMVKTAHELKKEKSVSQYERDRIRHGAAHHMPEI